MAFASPDNAYTFVNFMPLMIRGAGMTLALTAGATVIGVLLGLVAALGKMSENAFARIPASLYVWAIRGTPLLVQLWIIYFGFPAVGLDFDRYFGRTFGPIIAAVLTLGINAGAYIAEIVRAAILSIDKGQMEAARSIGMSRGQAMSRVILPQAYRRMLPPLGNEFIAMLKDSALVSTIAMVELMRRAQLLASATFRQLEFYSLAAAMYLVMTTFLSWAVSYYERRLAVSE